MIRLTTSSSDGTIRVVRIVAQDVMELHEELQGTTVILVGDRQCRVMETADELEAAIDGEWDRIKGRSASDGSVSADG